MNKSTLLMIALLTHGPGFAGNERGPRGEALTGTRILNRMEVVFDTTPIRLGVLAASTAAATGNQADHPRPSITFVLDPRLEIATDVFRSLDGFATDEVVTDLYTLAAVRDFLAQSDRGPYGIVNLVAHGSPQTGLNVEIAAHGAKASAARLSAYPRADIALSEQLDQDTVIRIYGCGVGAEPKLLEGLAQFFSAPGETGPRLDALKQFVEFSAWPELNVALRETLTAIASSRMAARRQIEKAAASKGIPLAFEWNRQFKTKPLLIEIEVAETNLSPREMATASPLIAAEMRRLDAHLWDFKWQAEEGLLTGKAVLGYVAIKPAQDRQVLQLAADANWVSNR